MSHRTMFASLREPGFKLFYAHSAFAAVDMNVRMAVHGWMVLELSDNSAFWTGIYLLVLGSGQLLFSSFAGTLCDRFQRRNVLLIEGALGTAVAAAIAAMVWAEALALWMAIASSFLVGCLRATRFTATNRFVLDLVGPQRLVNGISLWRTANTPVMIIGSILTGSLIDQAGTWAAYAVVAGSLALSLPFLLFIGVQGSIGAGSGHLIRQTVEGLQYAARNSSLRTLFTVSIVMELMGFSFLGMVPVMAKNVLETSGLGLGLLNAGVGGGMFIGTMALAAVGNSPNKPRIVVVNAFLAGLAIVAFGLSRELWLSVVLAGAVMGLLNAYDLTLGALIQLVAPPHMRGRAVSLHSLAISFTAIGGFIAGGIGSVIGVPWMLVLYGGGILANTLLRRGAVMRIREFSYDEAPAPGETSDAADRPSG